jgi:hypothetical protein
MGGERGAANARDVFLRLSRVVADRGVISILPCGHWSERPAGPSARHRCAACAASGHSPEAHTVGLIATN